MHSAAAGEMVYVRFLIWWSGGVMVNKLHHYIALYFFLYILKYQNDSISVLTSAKT